MSRFFRFTESRVGINFQNDERYVMVSSDGDLSSGFNAPAPRVGEHPLSKDEAVSAVREIVGSHPDVPELEIVIELFERLK